ncbi:MAG: iron ABC transporter permease [Bacilli bacterium]|nr:iron ABC transporter permease [Bacilli bacterium]
MDEQLGQIAFTRDGLIKKDRIKGIILLAFLVVLLLVVFFALVVGPSSLSIGDALAALFGKGTGSAIRIMQQIRVPRILAGILAGASLSLAGVILQSTLGNIMASPSTLGVTNAAVFGANLSILVIGGGMLDTGNNAANLVSSVNPYLASTLAFVFSTISVLLILGLSAFRKYSPSVVVLSGLAIGAVWTGLTTLIQFFSSDVGLSAAVIWSFGDLGRATYSDIIIMGASLLITSIFFFLLRHRYNALLAGEAYAKSLGIT